MVDRVRRDKGCRRDILSAPMPAPPCDQLGHVIVADVGDQHVLTEVLDQDSEQRPGIRRAGQMLRVLRPVARRDVVQAQRGLGLIDLRDQPPRPLALGGLYLLRFALVGGFRGPVKSMTSPVKVKMPVGRARPAVEGHGVTFRVLLAMNSLRSASLNIRRTRALPWPRATYFSAPEATWPLSVLIEQPSLAAACAAVLSPSGGGRRSLRAARSCRINASPLRYARKHSGQLRSSQQNPASPAGKRAIPGGFFCGMRGWVMCRRLQRRCRIKPWLARHKRAGALSLRQWRYRIARITFWLRRASRADSSRIHS